MYFMNHFIKGICEGSLTEDVLALMELGLIIFLHITSRAVYIGSTCVSMPDKGESESEPRGKR